MPLPDINTLISASVTERQFKEALAQLFAYINTLAIDQNVKNALASLVTKEYVDEKYPDIDAFITQANATIEAKLLEYGNNGGMIIVKTLEELQGVVAEFNNQGARVAETGLEYRWNAGLTEPAWEPTGRNFLSEAQAYVETKLTYESDIFNQSGFIDETGNFVGHVGYRCTDFIECAALFIYKLKTYITEGRFAIAFYDINKNFISGETGTQDQLIEQSFTTPINCTYMRVVGNVLYGARTSDFYLKSDIYNIDFIKSILRSRHVDIDSSNVLFKDKNVSVALNSILSKQQQLIDDNNVVLSKFDLMDDKTQPLFIDTTEFVKSCLTPSNFGTVNVSMRNNNRTLTVSDATAFTVNGACTIFDNVANTYTSHVVKSISGAQITFVDDVPTNPSQIQTMHDAPNGQHLNPFGYKGLADYILEQSQRHSYRKKENMLFSFHPYKHKTVSYDNPNLYDFETGTNKQIDVFTSQVSFGGYVEGTANLPRFVGTDFQSSGLRNNVQIFSIAYQFVQGVKDASFGMNISAGTKSGFMYIPISCDEVDYTTTGGSLAKTSGRARLKVSNGAVVIHDQIYETGMVHHVYVDFEDADDLKVEISLADNTPSVILLHNLYVYSKSDKTPTQKFFSDGDVIGFHGDSWTQYPIATTVGENGQTRPDGSLSDGAQYLSRRIKDKLSANGVSVKILNMGKGGQTSEWGKYWIKNTIDLAPTHVIISFAINDHNSKDITEGYDFSPTDQWTNLSVSSGGVNGRVLTTEKYIENMKWICDKFASVGIKPIVLLPPQTAAFSRTQGMRMTQLNLMYEGF